MKLSEWLPWYRLIARRLSLNSLLDQQSAFILTNLVRGHTIPLRELRSAISGKVVIVYGAGPSLPRDVDALIDSTAIESRVSVAADGASALLLKRGILPKVVVTDLDGDLRTIFECGDEGAIIVVHGHGDNIDALTSNIPKMLGFKLIATTQVKPTSVVHNFGGFTDGDRCVFMADAMGAREVWLVGMDFGDVIGRYSKPNLRRDISASPSKRMKLEIASELISYLSKRSSTKIRNLTGRVAYRRRAPK